MPLVRDIHALALLVCTFLLLAACEVAPQLMPAPNVIRQGENPFTDVPPELRTNTVDVLYLSDRLPTNDTPEERTYGFGRSRSLAFGVSRVEFGKNVPWDQLVKASTSPLRTVSLPVTVTSTRELGRFTPTPRSPLIEPGSDAEKQATDAQSAAETDFRNTLSDMLKRTGRKDVFISVHGVANLHVHAVSRIAEIWHFLGRQGVPIAYSWPAGSPGLKAYMYDRESSEFTVYHFKQTLKLIASCPEVERIHIIGHSRGTDVVGSALRELHIEYAAAGKQTRQELKLGTLVLAAPDLDVDVVLQRMSTADVGLDPERFVLYVGHEDALLKISNWLFGGFSRLGGINASMFSPAELDAIRKRGTPQIIDARVSDPGSFGHDYFVANPAVSSDLILVLRDGRPPGAQFGRPLRDQNTGFWIIDDAYPATRPALITATRK
jgi:esterase/lipase superfamily enzyme